METSIWGFRVSLGFRGRAVWGLGFRVWGVGLRE